MTQKAKKEYSQHTLNIDADIWEKVEEVTKSLDSSSKSKFISAILKDYLDGDFIKSFDFESAKDLIGRILKDQKVFRILILANSGNFPRIISFEEIKEYSKGKRGLTICAGFVEMPNIDDLKTNRCNIKKMQIVENEFVIFMYSSFGEDRFLLVSETREAIVYLDGTGGPIFDAYLDIFEKF